jgi:uncharacterized membrane protein YccC
VGVGSTSCATNLESAGQDCPTGTNGARAAHRPSGAQPRGSLEFAVRTTAAALLAFSGAKLLGIHHPWWAAMTVWLVAQPTRGLLLERSLARLFGTICGAIVGALILILWAQNLVVALVILAVWLSLCAGLGTIFRHFRNYGFVLAGYTAGIVVLFGLGDGSVDSVLAQDRVLCTLLGIVCSMLLSFRALPQRRAGDETRAERLLKRVLLLAEAGPTGEAAASDWTLASEIGAFDRAIDEHAAGSVRRRADVLRLRYISGVLLELIAVAQSEQGRVAGSGSAQDDPLQSARQMAQKAAASGRYAMAHALHALSEALEPDRWSVWQHIRFDLDMTAACRAAARPVLALAIAVTIWLTTGWQVGAMMAMTAVLFTSLFSSHEHGNHMVIQVLLGTLTGAVAGLCVRLFLLPHAEGLLPTLLCITPFLLVAAWLMRQSATAKMAIDMAMTFLLTSQPGTAPAPTPLILAEASAIISGVFIAVAIFWLVLPSTPVVRRKLFARQIVRLTARIASSTDLKTCASAHQALRSAQVRLLDFTEADSAIFAAAQSCLASATEVLAVSHQNPSGKDEPLNSKLCLAQEAALKASAALMALIAPNSWRTCND